MRRYTKRKVDEGLVEDYLSRPLEDQHYFKDLSVEEIDALLAGIGATFHTTPYHHQKVAFLAAARQSRLLIFFHMGLGKTKIMLDLVAHHRARGRLAKRTLVLVPNDANVETWRQEAEIHQPGIRCGALPLDKIIPPGEVIVSTYQRLTRLMTNSEKVGKSKRQKWVVDRDRIGRFADNFGAVICDESTAVMNPTSLTTKIALAISWRVDFAYGLTGTPFGRDPQALFSQFLVVDRGATFGSNVGIFRAAYFDELPDYWKGSVYTLREEMEPALRQAVRNRSLHYDIDDCLSLPEFVDTTVSVTMGEVAANLYFSSKDVMQDEAIEGTDVRKCFVRLRQIASGFKVIESEVDGRMEIPFDENPKLDALGQLLDEVPEDSKVVIFHEFTRSGQAISDLLTKRKIKHGRMWSGTEDKALTLRTFQKDEKCKVLVCNSQSGAMGLNLQRANYVIFFESPVSPIIREQARARCRRPGQTQTIFYYDIVVKRTVEEKILKWVRDGKDLLEAVLSGETLL